MKKITKLAALLLMVGVAAISCNKEPQNETPDTPPTPPTPPAPAYEAVDLGLSVKWATYNVGADKPEALGTYFAWGETQGKTTYIKSNYSFFRWEEDKFVTTKYNSTDLIKVLQAEDDAAAKIWGGAWRMPTCDEMDELWDEDNTNKEWVKVGKVDCFKLISKKEGYTDKFILLPAGSMFEEETPDLSFGEAVYWTSSVSNDENAYQLYAIGDSDPEMMFYMTTDNSREKGCLVRPVCAK